MSLRLVEILAPEVHRADIELYLRGQSVRTFWEEKASENRVLFRVLVGVELSGEILDAISDRLEGYADVHVLLLPVEAALPADEPKSEEGPSAAPELDESAASRPKASRISREELYNDISAGAEVTDLYLIMVVLSTLVAAIGLLRDDVAVVVGAMVIAPLLGPNMALALATTLADSSLGQKALRANLAGLSISLGLSVLVGLLWHVDPTLESIANRTVVGPADIVLALAAGAAGVLAVASGAHTSLVGVMVAVALMPPLVNVGLLLGAGRWDLALGAAMLVMTNVICLNLAGVMTYLYVGVRPRTWWEADRARHSTRLAILLWAALLLLLVIQMIWWYGWLEKLL